MTATVAAAPVSSFAAALSERYGDDDLATDGVWNETLATLLGHRSVRSYLPDPLPKGWLETIVAAAQSAPTSSNSQAWSVVAVEEPEQKSRLASLAGEQAHVRAAPLLLVFVADLSRAARLATAQNSPLEGADYLEAFLIAALDAALAAQNAVVAAESLGLGTCYLGALRNHPEAVAREIGLPPRAAAVFGLTVGFPDATAPAAIKPRLPQEAVLHRGRYGLGAEQRAVSRHDRASVAFRASQGLDSTPWSALAVDRLRSVAALKGRHTLGASLRALGFPIV
ncbi:nitroreductase family protein [Methylopila henanensis]|uniref:Nitroreductase family protein n=1 Tax=Methylopila henanensis TaxID=873516 RepID=A0ABW4KD34_9HYPH